jgi:hypothetical protein
VEGGQEVQAVQVQVARVGTHCLNFDFDFVLSAALSALVPALSAPSQRASLDPFVLEWAKAVLALAVRSSLDPACTASAICGIRGVKNL